ncbi:MAG: hypothetical protein HN353_09400 [Bdellovibrionales bacterium]|jgi:hypothetical protein|nr:hypothetical protein [Bdellovibrionales bacterium]
MPVNGVDVGVAKAATGAKGISLGLGLGLGIYGPILLVSAIVASPCLILIKEVQKVREQLQQMDEHLARIEAHTPIAAPMGGGGDNMRRRGRYVPGQGNAPSLELVNKPKPKKRANYNEIRHKNKQKKVNF